MLYKYFNIKWTSNTLMVSMFDVNRLQYVFRKMSHDVAGRKIVSDNHNCSTFHVMRHFHTQVSCFLPHDPSEMFCNQKPILCKYQPVKIWSQQKRTDLSAHTRGEWKHSRGTSLIIPADRELYRFICLIVFVTQYCDDI